MTSAEYSAHYVAKAIAAGLCRHCRKRPVRVGLNPHSKPWRSCDDCIAYYADRRARNRAAELCVCGRQRDDGLLSCRGCLDSPDNARAVEARARNRSVRLCDCGNVRDQSYLSACRTCRDRDRVYRNWEILDGVASK